jgi:hypothetical protein
VARHTTSALKLLFVVLDAAFRRFVERTLAVGLLAAFETLQLDATVA